MKKILLVSLGAFVLFLLPPAFSQSAVRVNADTGALIWPTNFFATNGILTNGATITGCTVTNSFVDWVTAVTNKPSIWTNITITSTSPVTAVAGTQYLVDLSTNQIVTISDPTNNAGSYTVTVAMGSVSLGGVGYKASAVQIVRNWNGTVWETVAKGGSLFLVAGFYEDAQALALGTSIDGTHVTALGSWQQYADTRSPSNVVRDTMLKKINGVNYIFYTVGGFGPYFRPYFSIIKSGDLVNWTNLPDVYVRPSSDLNTNTWQDSTSDVWSPIPFVDDDGSVIVTVSTGIGGNQAWYVSALDSTMTNWSTTNGLTMTNGSNIPINGGQIFKFAGNYYYLGQQSPTAAAGLYLYQSTNKTSGYALLSTNFANTAGTNFCYTPGGNAEAQYITKMPDGTWRLWAFCTGGSVNGANYQACSSLTTNPITGGWGSWTNVTFPTEPNGANQCWPNCSWTLVDAEDVLKASMLGVDKSASDRAAAAILTATGSNNSLYLPPMIGEGQIYGNTNAIAGKATLSPTTYSVSSLVSTGALCTATTSASNPYTTGMTITIAGASPSAYNGEFPITVTGTNTFTYTGASSPGSTASGTITAANLWVPVLSLHSGASAGTLNIAVNSPLGDQYEHLWCSQCYLTANLSVLGSEVWYGPIITSVRESVTGSGAGLVEVKMPGTNDSIAVSWLPQSGYLPSIVLTNNSPGPASGAVVVTNNAITNDMTITTGLVAAGASYTNLSGWSSLFATSPVAFANITGVPAFQTNALTNTQTGVTLGLSSSSTGPWISNSSTGTTTISNSLSVMSNAVIAGTSTVSNNVTWYGSNNLLVGQTNATNSSSAMTKGLVDVEPVWALPYTVPFCPYPANGNGNGGWNSVYGSYGNYDQVGISGTNANAGPYTQMLLNWGVNQVPGISGSGINFSRPIKISISEAVYMPTNSLIAWRLICGGPQSSPQFSDQNALSTNGFGMQIYNVTGTNMIGVFAYGAGGYTSTNTPFGSTSLYGWQVTSDGAGNVALWSNGTSILTLTGGPTNTPAAGQYTTSYVPLGAYGTSTNAGTNIFTLTAVVKGGVINFQ